MIHEQSVNYLPLSTMNHQQWSQIHNKLDVAVPYTEGVSLFSRLRRLGKPAWRTKGIHLEMKGRYDGLELDSGGR